MSISRCVPAPAQMGNGPLELRDATTTFSPANHPGRRSPTTGSGRAVPQGDRLDHLLGSGLVPSVTAMADPFIDVT